VRVGFTGGGTTLAFTHRQPFGETGGTTVTLDAISTNTPHVIWARRAGGEIAPSMTLGSSFNASLVGAESVDESITTNFSGSSTLNLGGPAGTGVQGQVAEILIFSRFFNEAALTEMRDYLNAKWGVIPAT
jgi:hypothetical protein